MLQNGVDVKAVQEVLGHEHLNTTEIYTHIDNEALRVAAKANPLSRVKIKGKIKEEPDKNHERTRRPELPRPFHCPGENIARAAALFLRRID